MACRKIPAPRLSAHHERGEAFTAALDGNLKLLGSLLQNGTVSVTASEKNGATLLMAAALGGQIHCVKMLLNRGADVNGRDALGRSALHYAIYNNKREAFDVLCKRGADCFLADCEGMTPLHLAAARGCISISEKLLSMPSFDEKALLATDAFDCTSLHHATWRHHEDVFTKLIDVSNRFPSAKAEFINARARDGSTALHYSCQHKADNDDWVEILLDEKAERDAVDNMGRSALHYATMRDHSETVNVLLSDAMREDEIRADPKATSSLAMLLQLRDRGIDQREGEHSAEAYTALQIACVHGSIDSLGIIIEAFLQLQHYPEDNRANRVNLRSVKDSEGRNVLHLAAYMGQLDAVKRLLSVFPDMKDSCDFKGRNSLFYCIKGMYDARTRVPSSPEDTKSSSEGEKENSTEANSAILECACFQYLVREIGCDVTAQDQLRRTALHYASYYNELEVTRVLLSNSSAELMSKWSQEDVHGQTALHLAAEKGNAASLRLLILRGITVNTADKDGKTALHLATENGHTQCVEILLQLGADATVTDVKGRTPAHYAALLEGKRAEDSDPLVSAPLNTATMDGVNCLRRLLSESSDDKAMLKKDLKGISPFSVAVAGGSTEATRRMVEELEALDGGMFSLAPGLFSDASGWSPLHYAAFHGRLSCLQLLLETFDRQKEEVLGESEWRQQPMIEWQDEEGVRPLHAAAQNARTSLMGVSLLINHGANAYAMTNSGCTVLHVAASTGHQLLCQHLISMYPDLLKKKDRNGDSARSVATHFGHTELAAFLKSCSSPSRRESLPPVDIPSLGSSSPAPSSPTSVSQADLSPYGRRKGLKLIVASPLSRPRTSLEGGDEDFELDLGISSTTEEAVVHVSKIRPPTPLHSLKFSRLGKQLPPARVLPQMSPTSHSAAAKEAAAPLPPPLKRTATPVKSLARSRLNSTKATAPKAAEAVAATPPTTTSRVPLPVTPQQPELAVRTARSSSQRKKKTITPKSAVARSPATATTPRSAKKKTLAASKAVTRNRGVSSSTTHQQPTPVRDDKAKTARDARLAYSEKLAKSGKKATTTAAKDVVVSSTMLSRRRAARAQAEKAAKEAKEAPKKQEENAPIEEEEETVIVDDTPLPAPVVELFASESKSVKKSGRSRKANAIPFSEPRVRRASTVAMSKKAAVKEEVSFQARVLKARGKGEDTSELLRKSAKKNRTVCEEFDKRNHIDKLTSTPLAASHYRDIREAAMAKSKSVERSSSDSSSSPSRRGTAAAPSTPLFSSFQRNATTTRRSASSTGRSSSGRKTPISSKTPVKSDTSTVTPLMPRTMATRRPATTQRTQRQATLNEENATNAMEHHQRSSASARKARPATVSRSRNTVTSSRRTTAASSTVGRSRRATTAAKKKSTVPSSSLSVSSSSSEKASAEKMSSVVSRLMNDAAMRRARAAEYEKSSAAYQSSCAPLFATPARTGRRGRASATTAR